MAGFPLPVGNGFSFSPVPPAVNTATQALDPGFTIVTFHPLSADDPGVVTLYNSAGTVILTMLSGGYAQFIVPPGGASYYFNASKGAKLLAAIHPNDNPGVR